MKTILVVDDEPDLRELLVDVLRGEGYLMVWASNGQAARALLAEQAVDLVITDTMMPGLDGVGLIRWMRAQPELRSVPAILISAALRPNLDGLGHCEFMTKPFELITLLDAVTTALGQSPPQ
ncbi:MAG TPA: response regulator [Thermomicrobiales bacterium]|nr:response regulator [Thermomicrobiales bacterium]